MNEKYYEKMARKVLKTSEQFSLDIMDLRTKNELTPHEYILALMVSLETCKLVYPEVFNEVKEIMKRPSNQEKPDDSKDTSNGQ